MSISTRETHVWIDQYRIRFAVYDDKEWFVTIDNMDEEFGASGNECYMNWNKGLAEAFVNFASMTTNEEGEYLMIRLIMDKRIDNAFIKYLPHEYARPCYVCPNSKNCTFTSTTCDD